MQTCHPPPSGACRVLHGVQFLGLLGRGQPDLYQVERADEPVADPEAACPDDGVPQRYGPVMLQQDQRGRGVVRDFLDDVPFLVTEDVDPLISGLFRAGPGAFLRAFFALDAEAHQGPDLAAQFDSFVLGQVAEMLHLDFAFGVLVHGQRVDYAHRVALAEPFKLGDDLTVEVRVVEPEHDELYRTYRHVVFLPHGRMLPTRTAATAAGAD